MLTQDRSPQDAFCFGFGALWGSVKADGIWSSQDLLGVQLQDIVGFSSGWHELGHHMIHVVLSNVALSVHFRLMKSCLFWINSGFSFGALWGSTQVDGNLASSGPTWASALGHCGFSWGWQNLCLLRICLCFNFGTLRGSVESGSSLFSLRSASRWFCWRKR